MTRRRTATRTRTRTATRAGARAATRCAVAATAGLLTACAAAATDGGVHRWESPTAAPPLAATSPYLAMSGGSTGVLVWPSGPDWLLLATSDGFAHATNRTPFAVDTGGGLVLARDGERTGVAVLAHEGLVLSPVLEATGSAAWRAGELDAAASPSRASLSLAGPEPTAVTAAGRLVAEHGRTWVTAPGPRVAAGIRLDAITWTDAATGWLTGHGRPGGATAYVTRDGGATWTSVGGTTGTVAALAPCGSGPDATLPVLTTDGSLTMLHTPDGGTTWMRGTPVTPGEGIPAWGCTTGAPDHVWVIATGRDGTAHLDVSADAGASWQQRAAAPADLSDLAPVADGTGWAVSGGDHPTLWRVGTDGRSFRPVALPAWVARLGGQ